MVYVNVVFTLCLYYQAPGVRVLTRQREMPQPNRIRSQSRIMGRGCLYEQSVSYIRRASEMKKND